jgi:hypothetical protein
MRTIAYLLLVSVLSACSAPNNTDPAAQFDSYAEQYVRLALALGVHDEYYVDSYFGDEAWREQAVAEAKSLADIISEASAAAAAIRAIDVADEDYLVELRQDFLASHLESMAAVASMRNGKQFSFDEESKRVYGFVAPSFPVEYYDEVLSEIDELMPGDGPLHERIYEFNLQFRVPEDKIEAIVRAGIDECRKRTLEHMELPEGEAFVFELVTGNPWGAYNWYQGGYQGLIQVEMSRPRSVFSAPSLGCHEGYPGHHAFSSLLENNYLQDRGWIEFSVFPLFSPMGIIFEGSGDLAEAVAFPGESKTNFLREVIAPIAGIENADFELKAKLTAAQSKMRYVGIEASRNYQDGIWDHEQTIEWLTNYELRPPENIDAFFGFNDRYGAYVINYVLGQDLTAAYVRKQNPDADEVGDWQALDTLLSYPPTPLLFADD